MEEQRPSSPASPPAPPVDLLQRILSNPEALQKISTVLGSLSQSAPSELAKSDDGGSPIADSPAVSVGASLATSDGLASILSSPEMMEKLPAVIAMMKPMLAAPQGVQKEETHRSASDQRDNLLLALKPFLSAPRQDAVDSILRIAKLGILLGQIK